MEACGGSLPALPPSLGFRSRKSDSELVVLIFAQLWFRNTDGTAGCTVKQRDDWTNRSFWKSMDRAPGAQYMRVRVLSGWALECAIVVCWENPWVQGGSGRQGRRTWGGRQPLFQSPAQLCEFMQVSTPCEPLFPHL